MKLERERTGTEPSMAYDGQEKLSAKANQLPRDYGIGIETGDGVRGGNG